MITLDYFIDNRSIGQTKCCLQFNSSSRSLRKSACFWFRHICWILIRKIQWFRSAMDLLYIQSSNNVHVSQSLYLICVCWMLSLLLLLSLHLSPVKTNKWKVCKMKWNEMHRTQWICCYFNRINITNWIPFPSNRFASLIDWLWPVVVEFFA